MINTEVEEFNLDTRELTEGVIELNMKTERAISLCRNYMKAGTYLYSHKPLRRTLNIRMVRKLNLEAIGLLLLLAIAERMDITRKILLASQTGLV